jgi:dipeptidyl aminopeptidase/acylaminoacyl peptidase
MAPSGLWHRLIALAALFTAAAAQATPIEVYGRLPALEDVSVSPDGSRIAYVKTLENMRVVGVNSLADRKVLAVLRVKEEKLRGLAWADDDHLMIATSVTAMTALPEGFSGVESEWRMLQVYDLIAHQSIPVPDEWKLRRFNMMNVVAGPPMVRHPDGRTALFVRGISVTSRFLPALIRFDLDTSSQKVIREGSSASEQWLVDSTGHVVAEQTYDEREQEWELRIRHNGHLERAAGGHAAIDVPHLLGFGPTPDTLLMQAVEDGNPVWKLVSLADGTFGPAMAERKTLEAPIEDRRTHRMIGGVHIDEARHYVFFDSKMQAQWDAVVRAFEGARVDLVSRSDDFKKVVVLVDGSKYGYSYQLVDFATHQAEPIGDVYDGLTESLEVRSITYPAADGLQVHAYLTLPKERAPKNLPLVVLPHGGPEARDTGDFDWKSQALAAQGYAVLRPNFRGSAVSQRLLAAGFGQWGRKMQTDLSDGVRYLAKQGIADPARVCIVGASYGGYAALAGVTLDPGVYRCAVAVAGLSDLRRMLRWENEKHVSGDNIAQRYWDRFMGVTGRTILRWRKSLPSCISMPSARRSC